MKKNRALFLSGFSDEVPVCMRVVSRIVDRQFLLKVNYSGLVPKSNTFGRSQESSRARVLSSEIVSL
jgi:hypothetical protein